MKGYTRLKERYLHMEYQEISNTQRMDYSTSSTCGLGHKNVKMSKTDFLYENRIFYLKSVYN